MGGLSPWSSEGELLTVAWMGMCTTLEVFQIDYLWLEGDSTTIINWLSN